MAILNFTGMESGDVLEGGSNGTVSISSTTVKTGSYALRVNPTTTGTGYYQLRKFDTGGLDAALAVAGTLYLSFDFRYATKPSANSEIFIDAHDATNQKWSLRIDSSGYILLYDYTTASLVATGTTALSADTWYRINFSAASGTTSAYALEINGTSEFSGTMNTGTLTFNRVRVGKVVNVNGNSVDFFYDNIVVSDSEFQNAATVVQDMRADSDGTYTVWTIGAGAGSDWENVDEVPNDGATTYLLSTLTAGDASTVGLESTASAGISGTILGAKYFGTFRRDGASTGSIKLRLRSGTTDSDSAGSAPAGSIVSRNLLYLTDPADSSAWTTTDLDGVQIGVVENHATNKTRWANGQLMVLYTPTAGSTPVSIESDLIIYN